MSKKILILGIISLLFSGCGDDKGKQPNSNQPPAHKTGNSEDGKCTQSGDISNFEITCTKHIVKNKFEGKEKLNVPYHKKLSVKNNVLTGTTEGYKSIRISLQLKDGTLHNIDF